MNLPIYLILTLLRWVWTWTSFLLVNATIWGFLLTNTWGHMDQLLYFWLGSLRKESFGAAELWAPTVEIPQSSPKVGLIQDNLHQQFQIKGILHSTWRLWEDICWLFHLTISSWLVEWSIDLATRSLYLVDDSWSIHRYRLSGISTSLVLLEK
jgi:hypothetical protein